MIKNTNYLIIGVTQTMHRNHSSLFDKKIKILLIQAAIFVDKPFLIDIYFKDMGSNFE